MASTKRSNQELQMKCKKALGSADCKSGIEILRLKVLSRGATGIKNIARQFKIIDDDGSRTLDAKEFQKGLQEFGVSMTKEEMEQLFAEFDKDNSGSIDFDEFLVKLRPPMSELRVNLIQRAFIKLDKTGDGFITVEDLKGVYNVKKHPKYLNGEWTEDQVLQTFLDTFEKDGVKDNKITRDEFLNYYAGVSASIDHDLYFDLMMRQAWKLED